MLKEWIRKSLTRRVVRQKSARRKKLTRTLIEPDDQIVKYLTLIIKFVLAMCILFGVLEGLHLIFLGTWNSEIFAAITGLMGTITGIFTTLVAAGRRDD